MATRNQQEDQPKPKTYRALKRTWLSHESRMVEAGEVFTTAFPQVPKRDAEQGVVVKDAEGRLVVQPDDKARREARGADGKPEMADMNIGDNLEEVGGDAEVSEPAIGTERGDKKPDVDAVLKSAQDHIDRQRASLPSPGMTRIEAGGVEPQRAMDGPPTRDTDDDRDGSKKTPAESRAAAENRAPDQRRNPQDKDRTRG